MAFFKKLKDRLFKSSSKLEEGLDAIIEDGGEEVVEEAAPKPEEKPKAEPKKKPKKAAEKPAATEKKPAAKKAAAKKSAPKKVEEKKPEPKAKEDPKPKKKPAEKKETAAEKAEEPPAEEKIEQAEGSKKQGVLARMLGRKAEAEPKEAPQEVPAEPVEDVAAEDAAPAEPNEIQKEPVLEDASKATAESAETTTEIAQEDAPVDSPLEEQYEEVESEQPGVLGRMLGRKQETTKKIVKRTFDDAMLESLEDLLISSDLGVDTSLRVTANIAETRFGKKVSVADIKDALAGEVTRIMETVASPMPLYKKTPQVVLVVGVNGSGKTTTIGKLASQFKAAGKSVVIAAGDTFRAAAVEQLQVWGDRAGVPVMTAPEGSDPASLAFDAMKKAEEDGADLLMIDTAGRLQNRADLMEELEKIVRVIRKRDENAPHNTLLVLDATTGQNALKQVEVFQEVADVSGLIMTKLDGTAKGGVLVSLADKFGLPIHAIGVGEQIDDLQAFDPEEFARALTGT